MKCIFIYVFVAVIVSVLSDNLETKRWRYTDDTSRQTCILVQFIARLNITYPTEGKQSRFLVKKFDFVRIHLLISNFFSIHFRWQSISYYLHNSSERFANTFGQLW